MTNTTTANLPAVQDVVAAFKRAYALCPATAIGRDHHDEETGLRIGSQEEKDRDGNDPDAQATGRVLLTLACPAEWDREDIDPMVAALSDVFCEVDYLSDTIWVFTSPVAERRS